MNNTSRSTTKLILESVLRIRSEITKINKAIEKDKDLTPKTKNDIWNFLAPFFELFEWGQYLDGAIDTLRSHANLRGKIETREARIKFNSEKQTDWEAEE